MRTALVLASLVVLAGTAIAPLAAHADGTGLPASGVSGVERPDPALSYAQREAMAPELEDFTGGNAVGLAVIVVLAVIIAVVLIVWIIVPWK